jgi:glucosamine kinase
MNTLTIGIDAGGTKTEFMGGPGAVISSVKRHGGANLQLDGLEETTRVLVSGIRGIVDDLNSTPVKTVSICAGISGVESEDDAVAVRDSVTDGLNGGGFLDESTALHVEILHDSVIAMEAAFGQGSGGVLILGTGSVIVMRQNDGRLLQSGGWGRLIGDDASGYSLGRDGLRAVAAAIDSEQQTTLRAMAASEYGIIEKAHLIRRVYRENWPVQSVADIVLTGAEAGDETARSIVYENVGALADQFAALAHRAGNGVEQHYALFGGLVSNRWYAAVVEQTLSARAPRWNRVDPAFADPAAGAFLRAGRNAGVLTMKSG